MMTDGVGYARDIHHRPVRRASGAGTRPQVDRSRAHLGQQVSSIAKKANTIWINAAGGVPQ